MIITPPTINEGQDAVESMDSIEALDDGAAQLTKRDYCCSTCWGELQLYPAPDRQWYVKCPNDGTHTYVRKSWVERRRAESAAELTEVREMMLKFGELQRKPRAVKDVLKDMGF